MKPTLEEIREAIVLAQREARFAHLDKKTPGGCYVCGGDTKKGAWGMCNTHYKSVRSKVNKDAVVRAMGGRCSKCGGEFGRHVFDFHHPGDKNDDPARLLAEGSAHAIAAELSTCELLCANCHRDEHAVREGNPART